MASRPAHTRSHVKHPDDRRDSGLLDEERVFEFDTEGQFQRAFDLDSVERLDTQVEQFDVPRWRLGETRHFDHQIL